MRRRYSYSLIGGVLSSGAPIGMIATRLGGRRAPASLANARAEVAGDPAGYAYISLSTAVVFMLFGYVLGRQADRLADLSETDALTGLHNARGLRERLGEEVARSRRYGEPLALLLIDLDGLKGINDQFGHRAGDLALKHVSAAIRAELRETDVGARWGGDEFAILAPNTPQAAALALAERVRDLIARQSTPWEMTGSIGLASIDAGVPDQLCDANALMRTADAALYEAKMGGRNRVVCGRVAVPVAGMPPYHTWTGEPDPLRPEIEPRHFCPSRRPPFLTAF